MTCCRSSPSPPGRPEQQVERRPGDQRVADAGGEESQPLGDPLVALPFALRVHVGGDEHPERVGREPGGQQGEHQPAERLAEHQLHRAGLARDFATPAEGEAQGQHADQDGDDALGGEADAGHDGEGGGGGAGGAAEVGVGHEGRVGVGQRVCRLHAPGSATALPWVAKYVLQYPPRRRPSPAIADLFRDQR